MPLLITDPRMTRASKKTKPPIDAHATAASASDAAPIRYSPLYSVAHRARVAAVKHRNHVVSEWRRNPVFGGGQQQVHAVPVLFIVRRGALADGIDLVVPCAYAMPLWVALQYATAHATALGHQRRMALENGQPYFPNQWLDTRAGQTEQNAEVVVCC